MGKTRKPVAQHARRGISAVLIALDNLLQKAKRSPKLHIRIGTSSFRNSLKHRAASTAISVYLLAPRGIQARLRNAGGAIAQLRYSKRAASILSLVLVALVFGGLWKAALASPDITDTWTFNNSTPYTVDSGASISGSTAHLNTYQITPDSNTSALYRFNETSGNVANDASGNNNALTSTTTSPWVAGKAANGIALNGTTTYLTAADSTSLSTTGSQSIEAWVKLSGTFDDTVNSDQSIVDKGAYKLYYDHTTGKVTYEVAKASNTLTWKGGQGSTNGDWTDYYGGAKVTAQINVGSDVYYGTEIGSISDGYGNSGVWRYNASNSTTTNITGNTFNSGGTTAFALNGTTLYMGTGAVSNNSINATVYSCDTSTGCATWTSLGNPYNANGTIINSLVYQGGKLYAFDSKNVYLWNSGTSWTQIGGTSLNGSWSTTNAYSATSLVGDGSNLYATLSFGSTSSDQVWKYNGTSWTQIGGGTTTGNWTNTASYYAGGLTYLGGNLYTVVNVNSAGSPPEVWRYSNSGTTWTKIGYGSGNPWSVTSVYSSTPIISNDGTNLYVGFSQTVGYVWKCANPSTTCTWTNISNNSTTVADPNPIPTTFSTSGGILYMSGYMIYGNNYSATGQKYSGGKWISIANPSPDWSNTAADSINSSISANGKLYVGLGSTQLKMAFIKQYDGTNWTEIGGNGINGSWNLSDGTYTSVQSMTMYDGNLYVSLVGANAGDGEVWMYDGTSWTKIGGDGLNGSWATSFAKGVYSLSVYRGQLYAGIGGNSSTAQVWAWNDSGWTQVGGGGQTGDWQSSSLDSADSMTVMNNALYVGFGKSTTSTSQVYKYNGTAWTQIGGGASSGNWGTSGALDVTSLAVYNGQLYAAFQSSMYGEGNVWVYSGTGTGWTKVAGGGLNGSWNGTYNGVLTLNVYDGQLYAGTTGPVRYYNEAWAYNGSSWSKTIAGSSISNATYTLNSVYSTTTMTDYNGALWVGFGGDQISQYNSNGEGYSVPSMAAEYSYGTNGFLQSTTTSQNTGWHKIGVSYDGTTMKMYIDGVLNNSVSSTGAMPDTTNPLYVGSSEGSSTTGGDSGLLSGTLDELQISNTARTSFPTYSFVNTAQAITLTDAIHPSGVWHWDGLSDSETANGGSITYRLSADNGSTWLYWNGSAWTSSSGYTQANDISTMNANMSTFPVTFSGIKWQAILKSDGTQDVQLSSITQTGTSDVTTPTANATDITAKKTASGTTLNDGDWTNGGSPYFSWTAGTDAQSGIKGYCVYLGQDNTADPAADKGMLGTSPVTTGGHCQYLVSGTSLDTGSAGALAQVFTSSNSYYYLTLKAIDNAGNVIGTTTQFKFKFDNTPPVLPTYITAPSGFVNTKAIHLTWPAVGSDGPDDSNSGVLGLQYRINGGTWYGVDHTGASDINDLLPNNGSYDTTPTPDDANLNEGANTISFRVWDAAGNISVGYVSATVKINTTNAPSEPLDLGVTPTTSTSNSFAFSWSAPATYVGDINNITYCYTINTLPSLGSCNWTPAGVTSLAAGPYATQPGTNTFFVAAKDESGNINYDTTSQVTFTANTPAPGIPLNTSVSDVSIKDTQNWRLALTWDVPTDVGAGINTYRIYRSTDSTNFSQVGTSTSTSFIDTNLTQQTYYYKLTACDSTNRCSADSPVVHELPTGRYTSPAALAGGPQVTSITTRSANVSWVTDRTSDSKVAIGVSSGDYSNSEIAVSAQVTDHKVSLDNLSAGTTYYLVSKWTDEDGNTGISAEVSFTTLPAPTVREIQANDITLSSVIIHFTTKDASKATILYGQTDSFGGAKTINTSPDESTYDVSLSSLQDGVKYYYKIVSYDSEGNAYDGNVFSFSTPPRPHITNLTFQPDPGQPTNTQIVSWTTNVPTDSSVTYGPVGSSGLEESDPTFTTDHAMTISSLDDNTEYFIVASSRDENGNQATSDQQSFHTALDTRPPKISSISVQSSVRGTGAQASGQIIVSWHTDELATSQVGYGTGAQASSLGSKTPEDDGYSYEHIVVVSNLSTSQVYTLQPLSKDKADNQAYGTKQTTIVGHASDSVLTIVLDSVRKVFGF